MPVASLLSYVAALSVATERVTELFKRIPLISSALSTPRKGEMEDLRVIAVHLVAIIVGMVICHSFPGFLPKVDQNAGSDPSLGLCLGYGLLASGGSSFWNSALDTFRGVKKSMGE
jgi:hypothetical protein